MILCIQDGIHDHIIRINDIRILLYLNIPVLQILKKFIRFIVLCKFSDHQKLIFKLMLTFSLSIVILRHIPVSLRLTFDTLHKNLILAQAHLPFQNRVDQIVNQNIHHDQSERDYQ